MDAHITGMGRRERRAKGVNSKPFIYIAVEFTVLFLLVFFISFLNIKILTVVSGLVAIYIFIMSCIPRYKKIKERQKEHKTHNGIH